MYPFQGGIVNTHLNVNKYFIHCEYYIGDDSMSGGNVNNYLLIFS
jgi:hypothetical protein